MSNQDWKKHYQDHLATPREAVLKALTPGCNIVMAHGLCATEHLIKALHDHIDELPECNLLHLLYYGKPWHFEPKVAKKIHTRVNFMEGQARKAFQEGLIDHLPTFFHEVPGLFTDGSYPVDVVFAQISAPNEEGYCSFGLSCDYGQPAARVAKTIVAEVNKQMPFIAGGDNLIHVSELDYIIEIDEPIKEVQPAVVGPIEQTIGKLCADLVPDGATLQLGIGAIPDSVLDNLTDRKDLGIHTELLSDGVMRLMKKGVITGKAKNLHPNKAVTAFITGSKELYDFLDHNSDVELYPVSYTNDPFVVGQNDNMISINSCLEVDLLGQVNAESIGYKHFSGTGGQVDFLRGVKRSKGGLSIIAMPSTAKNDTISRVVPIFSEGATVTTCRNDVDYVVTEYGVAKLRGKTATERAKALIAIAHPKFRPMLEEAAKKRFAALR